MVRYTAISDEATALLSEAASNPSAVIAEAEELAARALQAGETAAAATAHRARGLAMATLLDLDRAVAELEKAREIAGTSDTTLAGEIAMSYAGVLSWAGRSDEASHAIDTAINLLAGLEKARALGQRGAMRYRTGDFEDALDDLNAALPQLEAAADHVWTGRLLNNRALVHGFLGDIRSAERDIRAALRINEENGRQVAAAECIQNLGWILSTIGDIPGALRNFDDAARRFEALAYPAYELWGDRCETLIAANLIDDALDLATNAVAELRHTEHRAAMAEALLRLARATLQAQRTDEAGAAAAEAATMFSEQDRPAWTARARLLDLEARFSSAHVTPADLLELAIDTVADLTDSGQVREALRARLLAVRIALSAGDLRTARHQLDLAEGAGRLGSVDLRVQAWLTRALFRDAEGDRRGASAAARSGLRVVDEYQAMLGASDARAAITGHASELARLGLRLAAQSGSARRLFQWMERTRAGALRFPPVSPPDDKITATDLAEFRYVEQQLRDPDTPESEKPQLHQRRLAAQERIRQRSLATTAAADRTPGFIDPAAVLELLGDAALVEYGRIDGVLHAVAMTDGRVRQLELGDTTALMDDLDSLRFAVRRLMSGRASDASLEAGRQLVAAVLDRIDEFLVSPLRLDAERIVIVPNGDLHAVPWSLIPSWVHRPLDVVPSAELWMRRRPVSRDGEIVLVAGPRLEHAEREIDSLRNVYPSATSFAAATALVDDVLQRCDGASLVHVASHGVFRSDNPLFSALELGNGPLTVYDIERLETAPRSIVLSACDAGLPAHRPGNEIMGLVAALIAAGSGSVVAATGLVPDTGATLDFMTDLHERIARGASPGYALREAQMQLEPMTHEWLAAGSFVCFGRG